MRIPIIGPNLHTWPPAPPLYITNETYSQSEEVKLRKTADLTEDAARRILRKKDGIWLYLILTNGWKWKCSSHFQFVFFCFLFRCDVWPIDSLSVLSSSVYVQIQIFSTPFLISILIRVPLHLLIVTGRMLVCMVHNCTWARYLPATLLGLAVGQNILRALTFPSSLFPPSSLPFSVC